MRATRIKGLDRERHLAVAAPDDHADLGEPIRSLDRIEERTDNGLDSSRSAVTSREVPNLIGVRAVEEHSTKRYRSTTVRTLPSTAASRTSISCGTGPVFCAATMIHTSSLNRALPTIDPTGAPASELGAGRASSHRASRPSSYARSIATPAEMNGSPVPTTLSGAATRIGLRLARSPRTNDPTTSSCPFGAGRLPAEPPVTVPSQPHRVRSVAFAASTSLKSAAGHAPPAHRRFQKSSKRKYAQV